MSFYSTILRDTPEFYVYSKSLLKEAPTLFSTNVHNMSSLHTVWSPRAVFGEPACNVTRPGAVFVYPSLAKPVTVTAAQVNRTQPRGPSYGHVTLMADLNIPLDLNLNEFIICQHSKFLPLDEGLWKLNFKSEQRISKPNFFPKFISFKSQPSLRIWQKLKIV